MGAVDGAQDGQEGGVRGQGAAGDGPCYYEGAYDDLGNEYPAALTPPIRRAGFTLKEGKYVANLKSNSAIRDGEVVFGPDGFGGYPTSGIKGFIATVKLSTDTSTDPGGSKQIFAAFSNTVISSN